MFSDQKKISKAIVAMFMSSQFLSGLDFGFFDTIRNKHLKVFANVISLMPVMYLVTGSIFHLVLVHDWFQSVFLAYFLYTFIIFRLSNYHAYNLLRDLKKIDDKWNLTVNYIFGCYYLFLFMLVNYAMQVTLFAHKYNLLCLKFEFSQLYQLSAMHSLTFIAKNINFLSDLMFHQVYLRMNALKSAFEKKQIEIRDVTTVFKSVADAMDNFRVSQDKIVSN